MAWLSWDKLCSPKAEGGLGFKKLKEFNLALLAKQGWQLQHRHDTLVYRVLKAKYFSHCEFSQASLGNNPSYTWRSIMAAQTIVKQGLWWRIGNGEHVQVWGDKWLPTPSTYKVTSPRMFMHDQTMVSELIDKENASWKTEVVDALFLPHEAEVIKSIPLSMHLPANKQIWACSSNGVFTVRSAYWVAVDLLKGVGNGSCSDARQNRKFWRKIWELATP